MARSPLKKPFASETVGGFGGIDRTDSVGSLSGVYDMANLRLLPDGSLTRREGYRLSIEFPSPIRCVMASPADPNYAFVLAGEILYSVNLSSNSRLELSRDFNLHAPAFFFRIDRLIYLFCEGIYPLLPDQMPETNGYVPLVGRGWGADGGEVFEQKNMLSDKIRIDYVLDRDTSVVHVGYALSAVDAVYVNGEPVTGSYFERKNVCLPAVFPAGTRVLLCLSLALSEVYDILTLLSATAGYSCGYAEDSLAVLFGSEEPDRMFFLSHATEQQVAEAKIYYPDSYNLYCPATPTRMKNLVGGIRAVCGEPDCLLVAGQYETRCVTPDGDTPIPGIEGCDVPSAMAYFNGVAYLATGKGIWRMPLRSGAGELISGALGESLSPEASRTARLYYNAFRDELWVKDTDMYNGPVYVYDPARRIWVCFIDIGAEGFFENTPDRTLGFWSEYRLLKFVNGIYYDEKPPSCDKYPIYSYVISRWTDMGKPGQYKRLRRAQLISSGWSNVAMWIADDKGDVCELEFAPTSGNRANFIAENLRTGRTKQFQVALFSSEQRAWTIHGLSLSAIK